MYKNRVGVAILVDMMIYGETCGGRKMSFRRLIKISVVLITLNFSDPFEL